MSRLIDRLREAKEGSEELSAEVWRALCWRDHAREIALGSPLTESLDAAVSLCERVLPGWRASGTMTGLPVQVAVVKPSPLRPMPIIAKAATPALALCLAVLLAKGEGE